jgi:hypothetical protein
MANRKVMPNNDLQNTTQKINDRAILTSPKTEGQLKIWKCEHDLKANTFSYQVIARDSNYKVQSPISIDM